MFISIIQKCGVRIRSMVVTPFEHRDKDKGRIMDYILALYLHSTYNSKWLVQHSRCLHRRHVEAVPEYIGLLDVKPVTLPLVYSLSSQI